MRIIGEFVGGDVDIKENISQKTDHMMGTSELHACIRATLAPGTAMIRAGDLD
jgi:hypothetical protein